MPERNEEHLQRIDEALADLEREDAPEHLVQSTLQRVRDAQAAEPAPTRRLDRSWANGLAAAVVAVAAVGIVLQQWPSYRSAAPSSVEVAQVIDGQYAGAKDAPEYEAEPSLLDQFAQSLDNKLDAEIGADVGGFADARRAGEADTIIAGNEEARLVGGRLEGASVAAPALKQVSASASAPAPASAPITAFDSMARDYAPAGNIRKNAKKNARTDLGDRYREQQRKPTQQDAPGKGLAGAGSNSKIMVTTEPESRQYDLSALMRESNKPSADAPVDERADHDGLALRGTAFTPPTPDTRLAEDFLSRFQHLDGLHYQPATGYWANSYVPGDPAMRRLEAQLRAQYPQALATSLERNVQPFDAPENSALGVTLHATQMVVDGPTRVQLQVGLKAAERKGGLRPAMNVAVVLDLPEAVDVAAAQQLRALLLAMNEQRQTGDRFSVTVAGAPGGTVVRPDAYRHGTVVSFIDRLANGQLEGDTLDPVDAFVTAVDRLAADDDPNAVLGSSLVMLVSVDGIGAQTRGDLETLAHASAVAGMPVSVVALAGADASNLEPITLAGQGRIRSLGTPADAAQLIDRELHSASRTVARAVRLRIQLDPDVKLVDVIGSRPLDEYDAERVREAEQSIDARLSRTWGIEADRGEDEDGIQIVIPGLAAGENHVVLLDVVVEGPGAVADVQVRYKDLVQMRNGVVRASLSLADTNTARLTQGPLERNVLKNLLAIEIAGAARRAARGLANGEPRDAYIELTNALRLVTGLRYSITGWESDPELLTDEERLARFVSEFGAGRSDLLAAELEYAAYRKLLPAALTDD